MGADGLIYMLVNSITDGAGDAGVIIKTGNGEYSDDKYTTVMTIPTRVTRDQTATKMSDCRELSLEKALGGVDADADHGRADLVEDGAAVQDKGIGSV